MLKVSESGDEYIFAARVDNLDKKSDEKTTDDRTELMNSIYCVEDRVRVS